MYQSIQLFDRSRRASQSSMYFYSCVNLLGIRGIRVCVCDFLALAVPLRAGHNEARMKCNELLTYFFSDYKWFKVNSFEMVFNHKECIMVSCPG